MLKKFALMHFDRFKDHGLLVARVGLGLMFIGHGWPKMVGGPQRWEKLGAAMANLGIDFAPTFWGFMAAFAEVVGGAMLAVGFLSRPALVLLFITMVVAAIRHAVAGDGFKGYSHATEAAITFAGLFLIGPGRFSLDHKLFGDADRDA